MRPNMTVVTRVNHTAMSRFFFMKALSDKSQIRQQHIDQLDSDKWSNDSPDAIEQQVAAKKRGRSDRPIPHASESQWNQRNDNQGVENDRDKIADSGVRSRIMFRT